MITIMNMTTIRDRELFRDKEVMTGKKNDKKRDIKIVTKAKVCYADLKIKKEV